ncbi:MAG TPA: hypothetical protein VJP60_08410 [Rhizomicrobium sp.]|nr:hypothetical protein [Rhizomicrobium sp.]
MSRRIAALLMAPALLAAGIHRAHAIPAVPPQAALSQTSVEKIVVAAKRGSVKKTAARKTPSLVIVSKAPNDAPDFNYQDRIDEAQALAARQPVLQGDIQIDGQGNLSHFVWILVVGRKTGPLTVLRMDETGKNAQGFTVTWPVDNFINTRFRVTKPEGVIVFAQRRPVRIQGNYEEAVYTSYAPELDTKTMRAAGMDYLRRLQDQAYDRIQDHDLRSRVAPKITVADRIPAGMVVRLMIAEHIDPLHMKFVGIEQCVHEVLITIAANRGHAYAYAKSSAGARGLPQFIEGSYQMVRANYPKALLEPDFERGMSDLRNAVLASVLLLDLELTHLPRHYLERVTDSSREFAAFLAAGYNRNPARVVQTYHRTRTFTGGDAPFENKMYVRIQSWIGQFLKKEYGIV